MKNLFILFAVIAIAATAGCCRKECHKDEVIAKINNYEVTAGDIRDEARLTAKSKESVLDEIITKKILLQEAQKKNLDKDKGFMKEIERYWEQALLKLLINRKIEEFAKTLPPGMQMEVRQKVIQSELKEWIKRSRAAAKVKIYEGRLNKLEIK